MTKISISTTCLLFLIALSGTASASTVTNTYQDVTVSITAPDTVAPNTDFTVSVSGSIAGGTSWDVFAYSFKEDGALIDGSGFNWGYSYSKSYTFNKAAGTYKYTFIFGDRRGGHGWYDVPVDIYVNVRSLDSIPPTTTISLSGTPGNNGWYISDVQVTLTPADNTGGSGVAKTEYSFDGTNWYAFSTPFTIAGEGTTTVNYYSTDNAGNVESTMTQTVEIDKTPPTISIIGPDSVNLGATASATVSVTDSGSGVASQSPPGNTIPLDTSSVGPKSLTVTARDIAGNEATSTYTYNVIYDFLGAGGFQSPISNTAANTGKAGSVVPVKWQLPDGSGGFISNPNVVVSITYQPSSCSFSSTLNEVPADTSGNTGIRYDTTTNQYIYNWKTPNTAGCYVLVLRLNDGSEYAANFALR